MFGLFTRKKADAPPTTPARAANDSAPPPIDAPAAGKAAPGTGISYSPVLVEDLKFEHQQLLRLFAALTQAHQAGDMAQLAQLLDRFRSGLNGHLLKENVRLYIYLERSLATDPGSHALVRQFRVEMDGIGKAVIGFIERYRNLASDPSLAGSFGADLAAVGKVLVERIRSEEDTLYPLYLPNY